MLQGELSAEQIERIQRSASRLIPFVATRSERFDFPALRRVVLVWSCFEEAARGSFWHRDEQGALTCLDGWMVERGALSQSVAAAWHEALKRGGSAGFGEKLAKRDGGFSTLHVSAHGEAWAARDAANAQHLYSGQGDHLVAISNRAMLVATALERGGAPRLNPRWFAWWGSTSLAPLNHEPSPWRGVEQLAASTALSVSVSGQVRAHALPEAAPYGSWDEAREAHLERCTAWRRLPGVKTRLPLTGGKDSRAILSAILAAGAIRELDHAYIRAPAQHPDVQVASELAERGGFELQVHSLEELLSVDLLEQMRVHLFRSEARLHTWDLKAVVGPEPLVSLGGHFGELYRSHYSDHLLLGWRGVALLLASPAKVNLFGCLTPQSAAYIAQQTRAWIAKKRLEGTRRLEARDLWHREARMQQWAADALRADSVGAVTQTPLCSARLLAGYDRQTLLERRAERTHYELMRAGPEWLTAHRFAQDRWRAELWPWRRRRAVPGAPGLHSWPDLSRQHLLWRQDAPGALELLRAPDASSVFYEVFDQLGVERLIKSYLESERAGAPDQFKLKVIFGLLGARIAIDEALSSRPLALSST